MREGINATVVPITPVNTDTVQTNRVDLEGMHIFGNAAGLNTLFSGPFINASRTFARFSQCLDGITAFMAIIPSNP